MKKRRSLLAVVSFAFALSNAVGCGSRDESEVIETERQLVVPTGFVDELVASGIPSPTAMQFAPDGRLFVAQQNGQLRVLTNANPPVLLSTPFVSLTVSSSGERGLLGVAFDPNFASNRFVYVYYTATSPAIHNRVSRFTASTTNPNVAQAGSEVIILELDNLSSATNHNGGAIHFGPDGRLYVAVGENANRNNAQTLSNRLGKMLRINSDGTIPSDNPFFNQATGANRAIWALGLRNPFNFAFQPGTGRMLLNDVGEVTWEEINDGIAGSNYGWPMTEGPTTQSGIRAPLFSYQHGSGSTTGCAITGGTFYNPSTVQFPTTYVGRYFFADYCSGWIRTFTPSSATAAGFATGLSSVVDLKTAGDGSLFYLQRGGSPAGQVHRVRFAQNQAPAITQHPSNLTVAAGQQATFTVAASGSQPLSFQWQRNGSNIAGATNATLTFTAASGDNGAMFRSVVTNSFGSATSNSATLTVSGGAPTATITAPAAGATYAAGTNVAFSGTGTDPQDGTLPASAFTWEVVFHHDTHTHPFFGPTSGITSGTVAIPNRGETATNVWYRFHLTVRDSGGLVHTATRDLVPRTSTITLASNPAGLELLLDGTPFIAPQSFPNVVGMIRTLGVTSPQTSGGTTFNWQSWSDGGAATHEITVPATNATFTANFASTGVAPIADGTYRVLPTHIPTGTTARCADVNGRSTASGADIIQWSCNGQTNQQFSFVHLGSGIYEIRAIHSNLCMGVVGNSSANGADVVQLTCNSQSGQRWLVRPVSGQAGVFELLAQTGTERCLSVSGSSTTAGADIVQSACAALASQRFRIMP
ncbi:MAG TPA: PQQ-dependent sugar dehydrogenase [Polyangiaceae bacterium]